ncbi:MULTISPECIES: hypothetical protein [Methanothermobacter]|jgi:uncharacterized protein (UPF0333 family)|uniref:Class III signal peptide-containing protein n=2 Tax=Methanothermobacter TaxID=145260 RepID=O26524_METTH|nr:MULTISPECIES: hypothetical protein [Methanothermobacter]MDK2874923.1 hypothetical protein [Methanothermobacter sp.]AAB84930.1 unknown [Methanothermobacter thermautotrophicus str. Delta H]MDN5374495.1 hypothetical protein [Methanothermobacter sp.]REE28907.1 hypothetical protein C7452_0932 [Methanothermobacter defluvii]WBF06706.1 hypothetical protein ISG35_01960 [Methanothermobacter thermautotrophicus]
MDFRGQISAEFLLIVSFIVVIVLVFSSIAGPQSQENSIATAAREGATGAISEMSYTNVSMKPMRVTGIKITGGSNRVISISFERPVPPEYRALVINRTVESLLTVSGVKPVNSTTVRLGDRTYTVQI